MNEIDWILHEAYERAHPPLSLEPGRYRKSCYVCRREVTVKWAFSTVCPFCRRATLTANVARSVSTVTGDDK